MKQTVLPFQFNMQLLLRKSIFRVKFGKRFISLVEMILLVTTNKLYYKCF